MAEIKRSDLSMYYGMQAVGFSNRGYVAPTVYVPNNTAIPRLNYYATKQQAIAQFNYLLNNTGAAQTPSGAVNLLQNGTTQTVGINCDFYAPVQGEWLMIPYGFLRTHLVPCVFCFYTTGGSGPFWAILSTQYFGISATVTGYYPPAKMQALDDLQREVQLLKYQYNSVVAFAQELSKRQLNAQEQQIFNETILRVTTMQGQINGIGGLDIIYSPDGRIGFIFLLIAVIAILSAAAAWTIATINNQREKTKRINDSYNLLQWVAQKKNDIAANTSLSDSEKRSIYDTLDQAAGTATKVADSASKPDQGLFAGITELLKWGVLGFLVIEGSKALKASKTS